MKKFLALSILVCSMIACKKNEAPVQQTNKALYQGPVVKGDTYVISLEANPQSLNPILATDSYSSAVVSNVFDRLLSWDTQSGQPVPSLAEKYEISKDGLTYDFYIRKNATFHDGQPVTAEDVKFSFDIIKDPKTDAPHLQNYFQPIKTVSVVGPHHVKVEVAYTYFRNIIIIGLVEILPKHIYGKGDFNKNPAARAPVGSGPYKFIKWDSGRAIELERNKNYWGLNDPYWKDRYNFDRLFFRIISERAVALMALKKGDLDVYSPTAEEYCKKLDDPYLNSHFYKMEVKTTDGNGYGYIGWNLKNPLFESKKVRRALAMAMPREEINKKIFCGLRNLSSGPFPSQSEKQSSQVVPINFDPVTAKALLTQEGWKDSDGDGILDRLGKKFSFDLLFVQDPNNEKMALIYQQSLKDLGIELNIKTLEWTVMIQQIQDNKFDSMMMAWGSSLDSDPYQVWHSSQMVRGGSNRVQYKNAEVDQLLEQARVTLDTNKRNELYKKFSEIIAEDAPYLFLFERPDFILVSKRFEKVLPMGVLGLDSSAWFTPPGLERKSY